jgi:nitrite reductase/ring-hydroxylating ferredoxin subunit
MRATDEGFLCSKKVMRLYEWHKAEPVSAEGLADGKMQEAQAGGKQIGLLKRNGMVYAFSALCPHAGARLCDGWVDALGRIVCPLHSYRFDPANGRNTSGEGYRLMTYPVELRDDGIYVGLLPVS